MAPYLSGHVVEFKQVKGIKQVEMYTFSLKQTRERGRLIEESMDVGRFLVLK